MKKLQVFLLKFCPLIMEKSKQNTKSKREFILLMASGEEKLVQPSVFSGSKIQSGCSTKISFWLINSKTKAQLPEKLQSELNISSSKSA